MDMNESQLTTVLQEAFTCYLTFLAYDQRVRESSLPRSGKGVETPADVSSQQYYRSRVAGIETCLQHTGRIAARVLRWSSDSDDTHKDETLHLQQPAERFRAFLEDETPFLDHFTGSWIHPKGRFSAGSSDRYGGAANEKAESPKDAQTDFSPKNPFVEEKETKIPEVKQIKPIFRSHTRSLGIHPNVPLFISTISIDESISPKSNTPQTDTVISLGSSFTSKDESDTKEHSLNKSNEERGNWNKHKIQQLSELDLETSEDSSDDIEESDDDDDDNTSITSNMASAFYLQKGIKDIKQAHKLHTEDNLRKENIQRSQQQARQLAEFRAREEKTRLAAQEAYAKKLEREEKERVEQIRRDREAAQRAQERWEAAALARETEAMHADERRRREADAKRSAEEPRRSSRHMKEREVEKPRRSSRHDKEEDVEASRRSSRHGKEKDVGSVRHREIRDHASKENSHTHTESGGTHRHSHERRSSPARRPSPPRRSDPPPKKARFTDRPPSKRRTSISTSSKPEPPKRSQPARQDEPPRKSSSPRKVESPPSRKSEPPQMVDCVSCMEPGEKKDMTVLDCKHVYCPDCIKEAFKTAYKSHTLFKCCGATIATTAIPTLSSSFTQKYNLLLQELATPNPKFCSLPSCSLFLPPSSIHGPLGICTSCRTRTCIPCGKIEHSGVCKQDKEGKKLEDLAKKRGWKQCPNCSQILERTYGCLHMTCRCGANWCYACLRDWNVCGSSCSRGDPNHGYAVPPEDDNPWLNWADLARPRAENANVNARPRNNQNTAAMNFGAALADRMGANVQMQHDRTTGNTQMRGEGAGSVFPVIATAVLMALMRD